MSTALATFLRDTDDCEDVGSLPLATRFATRMPPVFMPNPIFPIAQQRPEFAADLIDRMHRRETDLAHRKIDLEHRRLEVQRQRDFLQGTVVACQTQCSLIAQAVKSRPDRDHFRVSTTSRTCKPGWLWDSDVREMTVTTQLDMW